MFVVCVMTCVARTPWASARPLIAATTRGSRQLVGQEHEAVAGTKIERLHEIGNRVEVELGADRGHVVRPGKRLAGELVDRDGGAAAVDPVGADFGDLHGDVLRCPRLCRFESDPAQMS
jgi:hypothetical protein